MRNLRPTYRRMRRAFRRVIGTDVVFPVQVEIPADRHGSEYGGWWVCPIGLGPDSIIYSVGVGTDITFDLSLIETLGVKVHAFDPTPEALAYVQSQVVPDGFTCHPFGLGSHDGPATFFPPANPAHISHTLLTRAETGNRAIQVEVRRLRTIMRNLDHERIDVLKMDIEGAEYGVLDDLLDTGLQVRQILVEFHHRFAGVDVNLTRQAVARLNAAGYRIFHASESGEEYSFILIP